MMSTRPWKSGWKNQNQNDDAIIVNGNCDENLNCRLAWRRVTLMIILSPRLCTDRFVIIMISLTINMMMMMMIIVTSPLYGQVCDDDGDQFDHYHDD